MKGRFATRQDWTLATHYPATVSLQDGKAFIGKYGIGQRCEGTDALPYDSLPRILATLDLLATEMEGDLLLWTDIIVEGDRINNDRFFQHLLNKGYPSNLYLVEAPLEVSMGRLKATGSTIGEQFVRTTATKSLNNFNKYGTLMHGRRIRGA